jgi:DNA-binding XRE family transcriptional regulator
MTRTNGLFEVRVELGSNIFRIFAFFDKGNLIVLGNGFQKKTQKTPKTEIEKALKIKAEYENEKENNIITLDEILDNKDGKRGVKEREQWEQEFEAFQLGVLLEEARLKLGLTQEQLAEKIGTNKSYISRIENNASDIRLSTLMKIIQTGLGGHLKLTLQL